VFTAGWRRTDGLPKTTILLLCCLASLGLLAVLLSPTHAGPYTAVRGPATALKSLQNFQCLELSISLAASTLTLWGLSFCGLGHREAFSRLVRLSMVDSNLPSRFSARPSSSGSQAHSAAVFVTSVSDRSEREKTMGETILCVDDDRQILTLYKAILQESGYQVLIEANGQDGLAAYDRCRVDCVVLDYQMSDLNGAEFVQEMFFRHSSTPVILISGSSAIPPELLGSTHLSKDLSACSDFSIAQRI
jgi:CheY-like chemotaxis protein